MSKNYSTMPTNLQAVLDIPMYEGQGVLAHDVSRRAALDKTMTLTGPPTWVQLPLSNLTVLSFNPATPDWLELAAAESTDMDFQVGAFSLVSWIFVDDLTDDRYLFVRGLDGNDGWYMYIASAGGLQLVTSQLGADQVTGSAVGTIATGTWYLVGATRLGASVKLYRNGVDVTGTPPGVHINPAASVRDMRIGIRDDETTHPWDGYIWRPRVFSRQLSAYEMLSIFEMERGLFGV